MTLALSLRRSRREFARPVRNARSEWQIREAVIITLESNNSSFGRGEVSPLPGFSPDSLEACEHALSKLNLDQIQEKLATPASLAAELSRASARLPSELPAARAGLEAALLELWSQAAKLPAWALLRSDSALAGTRRVAALLSGEPEQWLAEAAHAAERGVTTFKLKVGRPGGIERELLGVSRLRAEFGSRVALRLDANRSWSPREANAYLPRFVEHAPEFIEEPCSLGGFAELTPSAVPLALDESLSEPACALGGVNALVARGVAVFVLKPTLLGGVSPCIAWAKSAREAGAEAILSHTFDGPLGLALSASLALAIGSERMAHGLDLAGAQLSAESVPCFSGPELRAWTSPGFGKLQL
ncbi:MAG TPA: o-succinylbenzoate synthase [Polyangiaceae bacterium]|nr:o-succinylbenzoate synthase [Polyangiaceae bacterium]